MLVANLDRSFGIVCFDTPSIAHILNGELADHCDEKVTLRGSQGSLSRSAVLSQNLLSGSE